MSNRIIFPGRNEHWTSKIYKIHTHFETATSQLSRPFRTLKKKPAVWTASILFPTKYMESPKVQKVGHWLSKSCHRKNAGKRNPWDGGPLIIKSNPINTPYIPFGYIIPKILKQILSHCYCQQSQGSLRPCIRLTAFHTSIDHAAICHCICLFPLFPHLVLPMCGERTCWLQGAAIFFWIIFVLSFGCEHVYMKPWI